MNEFEFLPFVMWSTVSGIIMLITGFSYRAYKKKNNYKFSSSWIGFKTKYYPSEADLPPSTFRIDPVTQFA